MSARHRQCKKKINAAKAELAEREVDLVSYNRVIADMQRRKLSPVGGYQAIVIVNICRDATTRKCAELREIIADLERNIPK